MRKITLLSFAFLATFSAGVAYAQTEQSALQAAITNAEQILSKRGVGYPVDDSQAYDALTTAIETAKDQMNGSDETAAITTLNAAVNAYKSSTTEIQMPEDGKVYTITSVATDGTKGYMNYTSGTGYSIVTTTDATNANYPTSAKFVCKTTSNGGTIFFNSEGKAFIFAGSKSDIGYNTNKAYVDPTDANFLTYAPLTVAKMVKQGQSNVTSASNQAALFGYVILKGARPGKGTNNVFIVTKSGSSFTFNQADALVFYKGVNSSAMLIEETNLTSEEIALNGFFEKAANELKTAANTALAKDGIGYPSESSVARTNLKNDVANGINSADLLLSLSTDIISFKTATDIKLPEDGKAYTLTFIAKNGRHLYMDYAESGYTVKATEETTNANYPTTAKFICRKTADGKFVFVNNYGKYLAWKGSERNQGYNGNKGYTDSYTEPDGVNGFLEFQITKILKADFSNYINVDNDTELFGLTKALVLHRSTSNNGTSCFVIKLADNTFDASEKPHFTNNHTSALLIEEAQYPNTVTLNDATGIEGVQKIGTFSAPFRTIVPQGVKAYYVSGTTNGETTTASTTAINEGEAIPANTGILLTTTDANISSATMVPALAETDAAIAEGSNLLHASAGASKNIPTTENAYILTKKGEQVAFYLCSQDNRNLGMNKSYLVLPTTAAASKFSLNFGTVTGISNVPTVDGNESNAPVYDITGRRVSNLQKGGLYIKGGKKFIVK